MPYISTTTNVKLSADTIKAMKERMGKAITTLPGKSESWLMLSWRDGTPMAFQGNDAPCAICEVKLYGAASPKCYDAMTAELCAMMKELAGIPEDRVYVTYQEIVHWGWNGNNF